MDFRRSYRPVVIAALLLAGCRNDPFTATYIEEMNNQNRQLEDVVYEQNYQLDILKKEVEELRKLREEGREPRRRSTPSPRSKPLFKQPPAGMDGMPDLDPPVVETPGETPAPDPTPTPPAVRPSPTPKAVPKVTPRSQPHQSEPPPIENPPANPRGPVDPPVEPAPRNVRPKTDLQPPTELNLPPAESPAPPPVVPPVQPKPEALPRIPAEPPPVPPANETPEPRAGIKLEEIGPTTETRLQSPRAKFPATSDPAPAPPEELPAPHHDATQSAPLPPAKATQLFLNPLYTGGEDTDGRPGDEGLSVLMEPRNAIGDYVGTTGKVSVALLDPTLKGDDARVGRWDFDAEHVKRQTKMLTAQRGILLHMVWQTGPPRNSRLRLFVRMETEDGEKLQAEREIFVSLPGQLSNRWTPRTPGLGEPVDVARQPRPATTELGAPRTELAPAEQLPSRFPPPSAAVADPPAPPPAAAAEPVPEVKPAEPLPEIPVRAERAKKKLLIPPPSLGDDVPGK